MKIQTISVDKEFSVIDKNTQYYKGKSISQHKKRETV